MKEVPHGIVHSWDVVTVTEAAAMIRICTSLMRRYVNENRLPYVRTRGGCVILCARDVLEFDKVKRIAGWPQANRFKQKREREGVTRAPTDQAKPRKIRGYEIGEQEA